MHRSEIVTKIQGGIKDGLENFFSSSIGNIKDQISRGYLKAESQILFSAFLALFVIGTLYLGFRAYDLLEPDKPSDTTPSLSEPGPTSPVLPTDAVPILPEILITPTQPNFSPPEESATPIAESPVGNDCIKTDRRNRYGEVTGINIESQTGNIGAVAAQLCGNLADAGLVSEPKQCEYQAVIGDEMSVNWNPSKQAYEILSAPGLVVYVPPEAFEPALAEACNLP